MEKPTYTLEMFEKAFNAFIETLPEETVTQGITKRMVKNLFQLFLNKFKEIEQEITNKD